MPLLHREPGTIETPGASSGETDAVLVVAAQRDLRDFAALFVRYWDPVLRYCAMRLLDRQEAEDAASQVFVDAYASLHRFREQSREGSFRSLLTPLGVAVDENGIVFVSDTRGIQAFQVLLPTSALLMP